MKKLQPFRIDQGICEYDFNDYYAALGVPITADAVTLRRRYLSIAKVLHPDIYGRAPLEKHLATQYLAKLVNPAYHVLNQGLERTAYTAVLRLLGKRLMKKGQRINPQSEAARQLLYFPSEFSYERAIIDIAEFQYQSLETILQYSGQISELNLVYLLYQEGYKHFSSNSSVAQNPSVSQSSSVVQNVPSISNQDTEPAPPPMYPSYNSGNYKSRAEVIYSPPSVSSSNTSRIDSRSNTKSQISNQTKSNQAKTEPTKARVLIQNYLKLAEENIQKKQWSMALKELRNVEQIDNNISKCHALFGVVYMNQKLLGMAKSSFQKALKINPQEPLALKNINNLNNFTKSEDITIQKDKKKPKKGGFFGWLSGS